MIVSNNITHINNNIDDNNSLLNKFKNKNKPNVAASSSYQLTNLSIVLNLTFFSAIFLVIYYVLIAVNKLNNDEEEVITI